MTDFAMRRRMMVDTQVRPSDVTKYPIIDAMLSVRRENFVPRAQRETAYVGENIPLEGTRVILEPRTLAKMLDALDVAPDELVQVVGAGLGYSAAVIALMAQAVVALEEDEDLVREGQEATMDAGADNVIWHGGALALGAAEHGPYDVIVVEGGIAHFPEALADQLKDGGRAAAVFMDGALGEVRVGYKLDGKITWRMCFNAAAPVLPGFEKHHKFEL